MKDIRSLDNAVRERRLTGRAGERPPRSEGEQTTGEIHDLVVRRRPVQADRAPAAVLTTLLTGPRPHHVWMAAAFLLGAITRDMLGDPEAAWCALQCAVDLAETDQLLYRLVDHQTADLQAGADRQASPRRTPVHRLQTLTDSEIRVLRYLPTYLSTPEIADHLCLSVNTIKTHQRHLYQKLGVRSRAQAVQQARDLGLLGSSSLGR